MSELTYEDFKQRINIQEVLQDAGYRLNRKDGIRYPSYVRLDSNGRRIRGDKFIVTRNGLCCFQPPEQREKTLPFLQNTLRAIQKLKRPAELLLLPMPRIL